jgi:TRAP-type C4-dicarboxylate transport system substrate-binding protein
VIELVMNDHNPAASGPGQVNAYWADQINTLAAGKLHITLHSGGSLLSGEEVYRGIQTGVADIGHYVIDAREGFALNLVMGLPFMGWPEEHCEDKYYTLLNDFQAMRDEWKGITIISMMMMPPTHVHNNKKIVVTPDDLKGMKIMGAENVLNQTMQAAGATPVQLDIAEMATSLNSGLIDGVMNHFPVLNVFGALEFLPYHTVFGAGGINMTPMYLIMNTEKLNSLPADLKKLIIDSGKLWYDKAVELTDADIAGADKYVKEHNQTVTTLTPDQIKVWYDLVKTPVHDAWIKDCASKGLPGQAVYDEALKLAKE